MNNNKLIKFRFKTNHKYTTPGMEGGFNEMVSVYGIDSSHIVEGEPYMDGSIQSLRIPYGHKVKGGWYFHLNDIILVKNKPTIIIME